jgi:hypothetical protein
MYFWRRVLPKDKSRLNVRERKSLFTSSFRVTTESEAGSRFDAERTSLS